MIPRAALLATFLLLVAGAGLGAWSLWQTSTDGDDVLAEMTDLAARASPRSTVPDPDFPAIVDSAIRDPDERAAPVIASVSVLDTIAHDTSAFTQGFELDGARLFESTGLVGSSTLREIDPGSGEVLRSIQVADVFAEGMTVVNDEIVQITWTDEVAFRYDIESFDLLETHTYDGEGWGICNDGERLVMSDGTPELSFRDPVTFALTGTVRVTFNGAPVERINELECVAGRVWANIWRTPLIIEIDPVTGDVTTVINASELRPESTVDNTGSVLNGIAYDALTGTFLLTGKRWPVMYRVDVVAAG